MFNIWQTNPNHKCPFTHRLLNLQPSMGYHILICFILLLLYCCLSVSVNAMQVDIDVLLSAHVEHFEHICCYCRVSGRRWASWCPSLIQTWATGSPLKWRRSTTNSLKHTERSLTRQQSCVSPTGSLWSLHWVCWKYCFSPLFAIFVITTALY